MAIAEILIVALIIVVVFLLSALPLYLSIKFLGGKTTLLKTAIVTFITGILYSALQSLLRELGTVIATIVAFITLIWVYHEMFRLKWFKAFLAWLLQFVFVAVFVIILLMLGLGVAIVGMLISI